MIRDCSWDVFGLSIPLPARRAHEEVHERPSEGSVELAFTSPASDLSAAADAWLRWAAQQGLRLVSAQPPSPLGRSYAFDGAGTTLSITAVHMPGDPARVLLSIARPDALPASKIHRGSVTLGHLQVPVPECCVVGRHMLVEDIAEEHFFESAALTKTVVEALYLRWAETAQLQLEERVDESPGAGSGDLCLVWSHGDDVLSVSFYEGRASSLPSLSVEHRRAEQD